MTWIDAETASRLAGTAKQNIYTWCKRGKILAEKRSVFWYVDEDSLLAYLQSLRRNGRPPTPPTHKTGFTLSNSLEVLIDNRVVPTDTLEQIALVRDFLSAYLDCMATGTK